MSFRFPMSQSMSNTSVRVCGLLLTVAFGTSVSHPQSFGLVRGGGRGCLPPPSSVSSNVLCSRILSKTSNVLTLDVSDRKIVFFGMLLPTEGSSAQMYIVYFQGES